MHLDRQSHVNNETNTKESLQRKIRLKSLLEFRHPQLGLRKSPPELRKDLTSDEVLVLKSIELDRETTY